MSSVSGSTHKHVGLARQVLSFLLCFWSRLINLITKDTNTILSIYYMHNKEMPWFSNKIKVIISFGLERFISSKEIFPSSRFYFSNSNPYIYKRGNILVTCCLCRHVNCVSEDVTNVLNARR